MCIISMRNKLKLNKDTGYDLCIKNSDTVFWQYTHALPTHEPMMIMLFGVRTNFKNRELKTMSHVVFPTR